MSTLHTVKYFILTILIIVISSCEGYLWNCIDGNGEIETEDRNLSGFDEVSVTGDFDVYVTQGDVYHVEIETDENLMPFIITDVRREKLRIKTRENKCLDPTSKTRIYVTLPEIRELALTGSGLINCEEITTSDIDIKLTGSGIIELGLGDGNIIAEDVDINHTGSGKIFIDAIAKYIEVDLAGSGEVELDGNAEETDFSITGSGDVYARDLPTDYCQVKISGSGDAFVNVSRTLKIRITGSGDVIYEGNAVVSSSITGSGDVIDNN